MPVRPSHVVPEAAGADTEALSSTVRLAQQGDVAAYERLYREHAGQVLALCLRLTASPGRADELMQDAFVRAWQKLSSFRGDSSFGTWLHRVTVNLFLAAERAHGRLLAHIEPGGDADDDGVPHDAPTVAPDVLVRIDLERAIAALPASARTAFVLHDIEGYRYEEIADLCGVLPATVRVQSHRARRLLMEALDR